MGRSTAVDLCLEASPNDCDAVLSDIASRRVAKVSGDAVNANVHEAAEAAEARLPADTGLSHVRANCWALPLVEDLFREKEKKVSGS